MCVCVKSEIDRREPAIQQCPACLWFRPPRQTGLIRLFPIALLRHTSQAIPMGRLQRGAADDAETLCLYLGGPLEATDEIWDCLTQVHIIPSCLRAGVFFFSGASCPGWLQIC